MAPGPDGYTDLLESRQVDGLVISGPRADDLVLRDPASATLPIVLQGTLSGAVVPSVDVDNRAGARDAVAHLITLGHREVACITNAPLAYTAAADRVEGYRAAMGEAGLTADPTLLAEGDFDAASGHRAMAQLLARGRPFSAVFVASDTVAVGAIAALRQAGVHVPGDVSVVAFDDVPLAAFIDPPLTTIHLPAFELGATAGRLLVDTVRGEAVAFHTTLAATLVVRASTALVRPALADPRAPSRAEGRHDPGPDVAGDAAADLEAVLHGEGGDEPRDRARQVRGGRKGTGQGVHEQRIGDPGDVADLAAQIVVGRVVRAARPVELGVPVGQRRPGVVEQGARVGDARPGRASLRRQRRGKLSNQRVVVQGDQGGVGTVRHSNLPSGSRKSARIKWCKTFPHGRRFTLRLDSARRSSAIVLPVSPPREVAGHQPGRALHDGHDLWPRGHPVRAG